jgi:hypothetical protein
MKQSLTCVCSLAVFAAVLLLFAPPSRADASFTLQIPSRLPETPVGKVTIELELTASAVGSALNVYAADGSTVLSTISLTAAGGVGATPSGDTVLASIPAALPNRLRIAFNPFSQFASSGNLISLKTGMTGEQDSANNGQIPFKLVSPSVTATAYRMNTYTAPSTFAPGEASVRVKANAATLNPAPGTFLGRLPLDVILVLDNSGSMSNTLPTPPGTTGPSETKYQVLEDSINAFIGLWEMDTPTATGGGAAADLSADRIGLVFFSTTATAASLDNGTMFAARGTNPAGPSNNWQSVITAVNNQGPTFSTSIGAGLTLAYNNWLADPNKNDATMVLMTDGLQNTDPQITTATAAGLQNNTEPLQLNGMTLANWYVPIQSICVGVPGTVDVQLLNDVANQTVGINTVQTTYAGMASGFQDLLVASLKGNTMSKLSGSTGTLGAGGPTTSPSTTVIADKSVRRVAIVLGWEGGRGDGGGLDLRTSPNTANVRVNGASCTVQYIDAPAAGFVHPIDVAVVRNRGEQRTLPYYLNIYAIETSLDYRLSFPTGVQATGQPIVLGAELSFAGKPLTHLPVGSIKAQLVGPNAAVGTILHDNDVPSSVLNPGSSPTHDIVTPLEAKVDQLLKDGKLNGAFTANTDPNIVELTEDTHTPGHYVGRYANTQTPGPYQFIVSLNLKSPLGDQIVRAETRETVVSVAADAASSTSSATRGTATGAVDVLITPKDRFGNFAGPGYAGLFNVSLAGGGTVAPGIDDTTQRGNYVVHLTGVPAGSNPILTVTFGGSGIVSSGLLTLLGGGTASGTGGGGGGETGGHHWWIWILLLVLVLVVILFVLIKNKVIPI